ncbi:hypothetical protein SCA03_02150 [Streptomyces cacaoi]|uniref:Uncharacterized protein n=1 Tax=Streptomyces cacaoi TaxID=1898 RepID=A0A4Y3QQL9_STRCI|nr:hypothetical protein SCA03_02150 [Streptomyces cacaoi]
MKKNAGNQSVCARVRTVAPSEEAPPLPGSALCSAMDVVRLLGFVTAARLAGAGAAPVRTVPAVRGAGARYTVRAAPTCTHIHGKAND